MKIPKQIKVGGHTYKVIFPYRFKERTDIYGQCDDALKNIKISQDDGNGNPLSVSQKEQIFIHEVLHAVDWVYNAHKMDEETVQRLSEGLYQVLNDNKMLK